MGFRTVDDVLDYAPADLTPAERLVLVVLAGYADDGTRECWPGREHLLRRTGLKEDSLRKVFQRLAKREPSLDPRVPIGTDKSGRLVFAYEGARTKYRIPKFVTERRDEDPPTRPEEGSEAPHSAPSGGTTVPQRGDRGPSEGGPASPPNHQEPSEPSLSPPESGSKPLDEPRNERKTPAAPPTAKDPASQITAAWIAARGGRRNPTRERKVRDTAAELLAAGWTQDDLTALAEDMARNYPAGSDLTVHDGHWRPPKATTPHVIPLLADWCGHCNDGDDTAATDPSRRWINHPDGTSVRCHCHPNAAPAAAA